MVGTEAGGKPVPPAEAGPEQGAAPCSALAGVVRACLARDYVRFIIVGGVNTLFSYALYAVLILLGIDYRLSVTLLTVITIIWNYNTTGRFVFRNARRRLFVRFLAVYGIIYLVNLGLLTALVEGGAGPLLSQAVALPVIVAISFVLNKAWVFRGSGDAAGGR